MKIVAGAYYVHKSNIDELRNKLTSDCLDNFNTIIDTVTNNYDYDIVKYNKGNISFIQSSNWNTANEPDVCISYLWKKDMWFDNLGNLKEPTKIKKPCGQIYHNKWQFVSNDYTGFDIQRAKARTDLWNNIPNIKSHKCRIGYRKYWNELLKSNNIEL